MIRLPHEQPDQNAPPEIYERLKNQVWGFEFVEHRPSIVSVPGAEPLWLGEDDGTGYTEAFLAAKEFAHVHPPYGGSMHMRLPLYQVQEMMEHGWGEHHPLVPAGKMAPNSVMVFGPRDPDELGVVMSLIKESYTFARGT